MSDGLVDAAWWRARQDAYLAHATGVWRPGSLLNLIDHLERHRRDPSHPLRWDDVGEQERTTWFARCDGWQDCADFDLIRLLTVWLGYADLLPATVAEEIRQRCLGFRYWYTDPGPAPGVVDERWYWSENHRLLFHTVEHLAGAALADEVFLRTGERGSFHRDRGRDRLHAWFDEKARWGFSEWHSDDYYAKDLAALITLVELGEDAALVERASAFLDLFMFDLALHQHAGNLGVTHGRSYMKDKSKAVDQPVFAALKLCFDTTARPWHDPEDDAVSLLPRNESGTLLARARRYRPPEVVRRVAVSTGEMVDRERMGVRIDPEEPLRDHPVRGDGLSYDDPEMVPFWWDRSALTAWQVVPLTMTTMDAHGLWDAALFAPARGLREITGGDPAVGRQLAHDLAPMINFGLLAEVETVTWRNRHALLSSAQSYRPGRSGYQHHIWQATLDEEAVVFTTHPGNEPFADPHGWDDRDRYWTGSATLPDVRQHRNVLLCAYAPAFEAPELEALAAFGYLPYTHAWFPTERFDEVCAQGHWTFGRRGDAYVALWSWRPVRWRSHDPAVTCTDGLREPFDLLAEGGAANVWICEVGDADRWGSFGSFSTAVGAVEPSVRERPAVDGAHGGFDVGYPSPSQGVLTLAPWGRLSVDDREEPPHASPRFENPWTHVAREEPTVEVRDGPWTLSLDLAAGTRRAGGPT